MLWLNRDSFTYGYFGEDYHWLVRTRSTLWEAMRPTAGDFYRPFAVNIPYLLAGRLPHGLLLWKIFGFALTFAGYVLLWRWLERLSGRRVLGFIFATFWLFHPAHPYGLLYPNAFDYVLMPVLLISLLLAIECGRQRLALILLAVSCFSKEIAFAFPLLFLLPAWNKKKFAFPREFFFACAIVAVALAVHHGLATEKAGGYLLASSPREIWENFLYLGGRTFLRPYLWNILGWSSLIAAFLASASPKRMPGALLLLMAVFFLPLCLLHDVQTENLGSLFWIFPLGATAALLNGAKFLKKKWQLAPAAAVVFAAQAVTPSGRQAHDLTAARAAIFSSVLERARPLLADCGAFDKVVTQGLPLVLGYDREAEFAVWGLREAYPHLRFFLWKPQAGYVPDLAEPRKWLWVDRTQAEGHPTLIFSRDSEGQLKVEGKNLKNCEGGALEREALTPPTDT
ncbi:MAG TPA: hypothetical protein VIH99_04320 [Bdellovibrionota bacterium]